MTENNSITDIHAARLQHQLEVQSRIIEETFQHCYTSKMSVTGGSIEHRKLRYDLPGESFQQPSRTIEQELAQRLGVDVTIHMHSNRLSVAVDRAYPPVDLLTLLAKEKSLQQQSLTGVLGIDALGEVMTLNLQDAGHVLVADHLSSGKSSLLRTLAVSLALVSRPSELQFLIVRGSNDDGLQPLNFLPQRYMLHPVISEPQKVGQILTSLAERIQRPLHYGGTQPHIVVLLDGFDDLIGTTGKSLLQPIMRLLDMPEKLSLIMTTKNGQDSFFKYSGEAIKTRITGKSSSNAQNELWHGSFALGDKRFSYRRQFQAAYVDLYDLSFIFSQMKRYGRTPALLPETTK
jgi:hypothetical protein